VVSFPPVSPPRPYTPPLLTHTRHMLNPSHFSRFYDPYNIGWGVISNYTQQLTGRIYGTLLDGKSRVVGHNYNKEKSRWIFNRLNFLVSFPFPDSPQATKFFRLCLVKCDWQCWIAEAESSFYRSLWRKHEPRLEENGLGEDHKNNCVSCENHTKFDVQVTVCREKFL